MIPVDRAHQFRALPFRQSFKNVVASVLVIMFTGLIMTSGVAAETTGQRGTDGDSTGTPSAAALQAASWVATVPYGAVKVGFAMVGGLVGGLTYMLSAGNTEAAKSVWITTMYGTYVLTPEHLKGQKSIRFLGVPERPASFESAQMKEN